MGLEGQKPAKNHYKINHTLGYKHGCCIYAKLRKVQALYAKKIFSRASSDTCLKWLLGPDQDLVFTFSNPALKSALHPSQLLSLVYTLSFAHCTILPRFVLIESRHIESMHTVTFCRDLVQFGECFYSF